MSLFFTFQVRRAIRKSGDISKRVNATRQSFGEAKSKYTSVERQWNLLEARRKRLMKPWNQQIQIDVSAIENQILKRKTNKKKLLEKINTVRKKASELKTMKNATATAMHNVDDDVAEASETVDQVKQKLDQQWTASQAMPSFLETEDQKNPTNIKPTPSEEEAANLEDTMLQENGPELETLRQQLKMGKKMDESTLDSTRKDLDATQNNFEKIQDKHDAIAMQLNATELIVFKIKNQIFNETKKINQLQQSITDTKRKRILSTRSKEYSKIYELFLNTSHYVNVTHAKQQQKDIAMKALALYMAARQKLQNTTEMGTCTKN